MFSFLSRLPARVNTNEVKIRKTTVQISGGIYKKINESLWVKKREKSTAPGIPRRSPIQVLTGLDVA